MITTILLSAAIAAHPLTPFSADQLVEVTLHQERVDVSVVIEVGSVAAKQFTPDCEALASQLDGRAGSEALRWTVQSGQLDKLGAAGSETSRLMCKLSAPAALATPTSISITNRYLTDRVGANQIVVVGAGVSLPEDLPPYERSAEVTVQPGGETASPATAAKPERSWLQRGEEWLANALGDPTPLVLLLAVLMALLLGAAHAALPGHGKTVMALYMAGRQGRRRDAVIVGGTVTLTHTAGVLILGIATTAFAGLAAESVLKWLGVASGILITAVGLGILINGLRHRRGLGHSHGHSHHHGLGHSHHGKTLGHSHDDNHDLSHGDGHGHGLVDGDGHGGGKRSRHGKAHSHGHHDDSVVHGGKGHHHGHDHHGHSHGHGRKNLAVLGIAGGLVPSPTALVVLLGAAALGRLWLGIVLIIAYGLGMAAMLTAAGLLLLRIRDKWAWLGRLVVPAEATGSVIIVLGFGLAARAVLAF